MSCSVPVAQSGAWAPQSAWQVQGSPAGGAGCCPRSPQVRHCTHSVQLFNRAGLGAAADWRRSRSSRWLASLLPCTGWWPGWSVAGPAGDGVDRGCLHWCGHCSACGAPLVLDQSCLLPGPSGSCCWHLQQHPLCLLDGGGPGQPDSWMQDGYEMVCRPQAPHISPPPAGSWPTWGAQPASSSGASSPLRSDTGTATASHAAPDGCQSRGRRTRWTTGACSTGMAPCCRW